MRSSQPSRLASLFLLAGAIIVIGAIAVALVFAFQLNRPPATLALAPAPKVAITFLPTPAVNVGAPAETALARERDLRRASQMATSIARASATAAASSPTPATARRVGAPIAATHALIDDPTPTVALTVPAAATPTAVPQAASPACRQTEGNIVRESVKSAGLNDTIPVLIALPPCFDPILYRYPALYLLQGSGNVEGQWERLGLVTRAQKLMAAGEIPSFLIVLPNNDIDMGDASKFVNSAEGRGSWEDFIVNDVVPLVDAKYAGWANPVGRAIGGISRGGYWSLEIAFRNPKIFGSVGAHSPVITAEFLVGAPDNFRMTMMARSPEDLKQLRIWLDVGDTDLYTVEGPDNLTESLLAIGVKAQFTIGSGAHDDAYWASRVDDYLAFYIEPWLNTAPIAAKR
ncbi:MAG: alpha/beta hydrolase-fold protein [Thermoflexales bacterium]